MLVAEGRIHQDTKEGEKFSLQLHLKFEYYDLACPELDGVGAAF